ncbi:MAG: sugar phosphate isomerase/epimerase [Gammaproteobacteria bacterium]|nr:sugar phosphate isomerase/epimerase [Gammaproteobacteria bacterium]
MLYSVRDLLEKNFVGTIEKIASHGIDTVELPALTTHPMMNEPLFGHTIQELRDILTDHGLRVASSHTDPTQDIGPQLEAARELSVEYLVVPIVPEFMEFSPEGPRLREDIDHGDCLAVAERLNAIGERCQREGIMAAYHNHHAEFLSDSEKTPYDIILENTDPKLVTMELDVGWVAKAGLDPQDVFTKYPDRFSLCHLKDLDPERLQTGFGEEFVAPGDGVLRLEEVIHAARNVGVCYGFVECDFPEDSDALLEKTASFIRDVVIPG